MLFEFKSRATGSVVMTEPVGRKMLEVIGKTADPRGIVTAAQLPVAIAALKAAVEAERLEIAQLLDTDRPEATDGGDEAHAPEYASMVRFSQRAAPLIEMFERSLAAERDVTWGV
jgi:hypothetical protein